VRPDTTRTAVERDALESPTFEQVYAARRTGLHRLAFVITGSDEVAEELVQEAFARLHERWGTVENPAAYVSRVVTNLGRTEARRRRQERDSLPSPVVIGIPEIDETWAAVSRLPYRQRAVLILRYYADLPEAEIAVVLGCRLGTVKSAHHRAVERLRRELT
jgi:RNA polymerase sigma-70 factor (sigma-E family)